MSDAAPIRTLKVLVFSDDRNTRQAVIGALGPRPAPELGVIEVIECATAPAVVAAVDQGTFDLVILDGEAAPLGGMGVGRQLKDEVYECPPVLLLVARPQDAWLATWSKAEAIAMQPINPLALAETAAALLRERVAVAS